MKDCDKAGFLDKIMETTCLKIYCVSID